MQQCDLLDVDMNIFDRKPIRYILHNFFYFCFFFNLFSISLHFLFFPGLAANHLIIS